MCFNFFLPCKGFCQVKKIPEIRENHGSGWAGQAPTRISFFWEKYCVFCVVFFVVDLYMFPKKIG